MKLRAITCKILLLVIMLMTVGCGSKEVTKDVVSLKPQNNFGKNEEDKEIFSESENISEEETDYTKIYDEVLADYLNLIRRGEEAFDGANGVFEAMIGLQPEEALMYIGYTIQDVSGDGIPELLIGDYSEANGGFGTMIYALYNCAKDTPECTFEGWYRNSYHWMGEGSFIYSGSGGAIYSMFGTATLSKDGTALQWNDYYFTYEKDEKFEEIGCYHNTIGEADKGVSEELNITMDDFWDIESQILGKGQRIQLTPFSELAKAEDSGNAGRNESGLERVRRQIVDNGDICAVGYLGYFDGTYEELDAYFKHLGILKDYDFLSDIDKEHFIVQEGYELYVVIPKTNESSLIVNEYLMNENPPNYAGPGNEIGRFFDGHPVLMRGNISEVLPNLYFETENPDGEFIAYNPGLSLRDGSLNAILGIYDLTPYEALGIEKEPAEGTELVGIWRTIDADGFEHTISFSYSGECSYGMVDDEGSVVVAYSGWWEMLDGELTLALWEDAENSEAGIFGTYIPKRLSDETLRLNLSSGDALTTNMYYDWYEDFERSYEF